MRINSPQFWDLIGSKSVLTMEVLQNGYHNPFQPQPLWHSVVHTLYSCTRSSEFWQCSLRNKLFTALHKFSLNLKKISTLVSRQMWTCSDEHYCVKNLWLGMLSILFLVLAIAFIWFWTTLTWIQNTSSTAQNPSVNDNIFQSPTVCEKVTD